MPRRTELWNIRITEGHIVGRADLLIESSGKMTGTFVFPAYGASEEPVTGQINGNSIRITRQLGGLGPQTWTGQYNANGSAAQGTAVNGGTFHWSATIVVE
jgi:hypothetical protein